MLLHRRTGAGEPVFPDAPEGRTGRGTFRWAQEMTNPGIFSANRVVVGGFSLLVVLSVTSCGSTTASTSRQTGDASTSTGGIDSSTTGSGGRTGSGGTAGSLDASVAGVPLSCSSSPSVTNIVQTSLPQTPVPPGTGGTQTVGRLDPGADGEVRLPGLPTDPCVTFASPACPGGPRSIFGCPTIRGPNGSSTIHPGDQITVTVPMSDEGLASYSCFGIDSNNTLVGGYYLTYAVKPAYAQATGQVPPSLKPGTVIHFTAEASGSRYTSGPGAACSNDLTRIEFDVMVGG